MKYEVLPPAVLLPWQVAEIKYLSDQGISPHKIADLFDINEEHVSVILRKWQGDLEHIATKRTD